MCARCIFWARLSRQVPTPTPRRQQKPVSMESTPAATVTSDDDTAHESEDEDSVMFIGHPSEASASIDSQVDRLAEDKTVSIQKMKMVKMKILLLMEKMGKKILSV